MSEQETFALGELKNYSRTIEVIESADVVGTGTKEDPRRTLLRIWAKDGSRLLGIIDPLKEYQEMNKQHEEKVEPAVAEAPKVSEV